MRVADFAQKIKDVLHNDLFRTDIDDSGEIVQQTFAQCHYIQDSQHVDRRQKEAAENKITWRRYAVKEQKTMSFDDFHRILQTMRNQRIMDNFADVTLPE